MSRAGIAGGGNSLCRARGSGLLVSRGAVRELTDDSREEEWTRGRRRGILRRSLCGLKRCLLCY